MERFEGRGVFWILLQDFSWPKSGEVGNLLCLRQEKALLNEEI